MKYTDLIGCNISALKIDENPKSISMQEIYINLAKMLALKSTCKRGKAGCVVVRHGRIISTGYNGSPDKAEECISRKECRQAGTIVTAPLSYLEQPKQITIKTEGCFDSIHAEANAFGYCAKHGISTEGCSVFITGPPCKSCSQLMKAAGVKTIYYDDKYYRNDDGLLYAKIYGIELIKMESK